MSHGNDLRYLNSGFAHPENRHVSLFPWQVYSPPWWACLQAYWGALSVPRVTWNSPIFAHVLNLDSFRRNLYIYYRSCGNRFTRHSAECITETFDSRGCEGCPALVQFQPRISGSKFGQARVDINSPDIPQCASPRHLILRGPWRFLCIRAISAMNF